MDTETQNHKTKNEYAIWCITPNGLSLAEFINDKLVGIDVYVSKTIWNENISCETIYRFKKLSVKLKEQFNNYTGHIFIFSTGIAVRLIAPCIDTKMKDPGVVVIDDNGNHVISLLSGHVGGANELAIKIAAIIKASPVITTATDSNNLPAIDVIAKRNNMHIETPKNIKRINMSFLMGTAVYIQDPYGLIQHQIPGNLLTTDADEIRYRSIFCSPFIGNVSRETLILRPKILSVGIGCNRGTSYTIINNFLKDTFKDAGLSLKSIGKLSTTEIKDDEEGLLTLSEQMKIPMSFYDKDKLNSVKSIETPSKMVEKHLGVKSVCEAAAILSANHGKLILPKKKNKDVTIAVAIIK